MSDLKPCPFCGSESVDVIEHKSHMLASTFGVICLQCEAQTKQFFTAKRTAIRAWNRRAKDE